LPVTKKPGFEEGRWNLGRGGELALRRDGVNESASVKAEILEAGPAFLLVRVHGEQAGQKARKRRMRLAGRWTIDSRNRLVFEVERANGVSDALTLDGAWEIGRDLSIRYQFARSGKNPAREISLEGVWDFPGPGELVYTLENGDALRFRAALQTRSVRAKRGEIRWQIGIDARRRLTTRTLALFGKWRLRRDLSLAFETSFGGRRRSIAFDAVYRVGARDSVAVGLAGSNGRPLGVEVVFKREVSKDASAFVRLEKNAKETLAEAGFTFAW